MVDGFSPAHPSYGSWTEGPTMDGRIMIVSTSLFVRSKCSQMHLLKVYVFGKPNSCIAADAYDCEPVMDLYNSTGSYGCKENTSSGRGLVCVPVFPPCTNAVLK